jgi:hypothetical protein
MKITKCRMPHLNIIRPHTIIKMNDNINLESTIAGSMHDRS